MRVLVTLFVSFSVLAVKGIRRRRGWSESHSFPWTIPSVLHGGEFHPFFSLSGGSPVLLVSDPSVVNAPPSPTVAAPPQRADISGHGYISVGDLEPAQPTPRASILRRSYDPILSESRIIEDWTESAESVQPDLSCRDRGDCRDQESGTSEEVFGHTASKEAAATTATTSGILTDEELEEEALQAVALRRRGSRLRRRRHWDLHLKKDAEANSETTCGERGPSVGPTRACCESESQALGGSEHGSTTLGTVADSSRQSRRATQRVPPGAASSNVPQAIPAGVHPKRERRLRWADDSGDESESPELLDCERSGAGGNGAPTAASRGDSHDDVAVAPDHSRPTSSSGSDAVGHGRLTSEGAAETLGIIEASGIDPRPGRTKLRRKRAPACLESGEGRGYYERASPSPRIGAAVPFLTGFLWWKRSETGDAARHGATQKCGNLRCRHCFSDQERYEAGSVADRAHGDPKSRRSKTPPREILVKSPT